jgi:uncharacterized protein YbjT (DUF2867 family)
MILNELIKSKRILITGATGNIGSEVINQLISNQINKNIEIIAGVRNVEKAKSQFKEWNNKIQFEYFDFEEKSTFNIFKKNINCVFLLRPPHISDVNVFKVLIEVFQENSVQEIIFLSVQGAKKSELIPHNKIERKIKKSKIDYIFIRPSYFMQNLTTELVNDIKTKKEIILPAGKAKFNWIDVKNIAEVAAKLIYNFDDYRNREIEITGYENKDFQEVATLISEKIGKKVEYRNVNPLKFFLIKRKQKMPIMKIIVMVLLHFLPRFQKEPEISDNYKQITAKRPTSLVEFIEREKQKFIY